MIEQILCAAVHLQTGKEIEHQPKNISSGIVVCGLRHCNCLLIAWQLDPEKKAKRVQGFLTNKNRFVERVEGAEIAFKAKQISEIKKRLFSEDLY